MLIQKSDQSIHVLAKTDNSVICMTNVKRNCSANNNYLLTSVIYSQVSFNRNISAQVNNKICLQYFLLLQNMILYISMTPTKPDRFIKNVK